MKKLLLFVVIFVFGCEEFTTSYERIDDREFRLLDFVYEPAEIAPGDSFTLMAIFAGKDVGDLNEFIDWKISFNVNINLFGETTVLNEIPLETVARRIDRNFSAQTQTVAFRIKVPDDIVRTSSSIPNNWIEMLPASMRSVVPPEFADLTKDEVVDIIEEFAYDGGYFIDMYPAIRTMLQFLTVPIRISAKINDPNSRFEQGHTIVSTHSVRYNRHFYRDFYSNVAINTNPRIDIVEVHRVRGDVFNFSWSQIDRTFRLYMNASTNSIHAVTPPLQPNELVIEDGYSYFLDASSYPGYVSDFDDYWTLDGNLMTERQTIFRYFHLGGENFHEVDHTKFMTINNWTGKITPPTDRRITDFTFWVLVEDDAQNERLRPQGSALAEVSGKFVYR